eukprot:s4344_g2.t1
MDALITKVGVDIPMARVHEYWRVHRDELKEDWAVASPASREHIPFAFYGDAAKIHDDGTKILGVFITFPAVWRPKSARNGRWCVFALEEHKLFGHHTMHCVLQRLVYSANLLFHGVDPDDNSRFLAGGRKFVVTELKGDWQWHKLTMRFVSSWTNLKTVCFLCDAKGRSGNDPGMLYYCMDEDPKWNHYDLQGFLANQMAGVVDPCPFVLLHGFHPQILQPCSMHAINLGMVLSQDQGETLYCSGRLFCKRYLALCLDATRRGIDEFRLRPKVEPIGQAAVEAQLGEAIGRVRRQGQKEKEEMVRAHHEKLLQGQVEGAASLTSHPPASFSRWRMLSSSSQPSGSEEPTGSGGNWRNMAAMGRLRSLSQEAPSSEALCLTAPLSPSLVKRFPRSTPCELVQSLTTLLREFTEPAKASRQELQILAFSRLCFYLPPQKTSQDSSAALWAELGLSDRKLRKVQETLLQIPAQMLEAPFTDFSHPNCCMLHRDGYLSLLQLTLDEQMLAFIYCGGAWMLWANSLNTSALTECSKVPAYFGVSS